MNLKIGIGIVSLLLISGCASLVSPGGVSDRNCVGILECVEDPTIIELPTHEKLLSLPPAVEKPVIAVYKFLDKTGQRKQKGDAAMFSTAVSQGSETMLIDALKTAGNGTWFRVVERVGVDHLTRERSIVRSTRESYGEEKKLAPLLFAGIILEGGIIGYDFGLNRIMSCGLETGFNYGYKINNLSGDLHTNIMTIPLMATLKIYIPNLNGINFFVKGGAAVSYQQITDEKYNENKKKLDYKPIAKIGVGWQLQNFNIFMQYSYIFGKNWNSLDNKNDDTPIISFNSLTLGFTYNLPV